MLLKPSPPPLLKSLLFALLIIVVTSSIVFLPRLHTTERRSKAAATGFPITGTFFLQTSRAFDSMEVLDAYFLEMKQTGIDTVIVGIGYTIKDQSGFHDYDEITENLIIPKLLRVAHKHNMHLYFAVANFASGNINPWSGDPNDPNSDTGHMIQIALSQIAKLRTFVQTVNSTYNINIQWDDPNGIIGGFYIWPETDIYGYGNGANPSTIPFTREISRRIKQLYPNKKLIISPWMMEWQEYAHAFEYFNNVFSQTSIDIIMPQDSMGTTKVTSLAKNTEHFRALHDAAARYPGKEAWANIESFQSPLGDNGKFEPTTLLKLQGQIASAKPYVSKMITFAYQYSMHSDPAFDIFRYPHQILSPPHEAIRRKNLRTSYMDTYASSSPSKLYYCDTSSYSCQQTSATYNPTSHMQTDNPSISCESNLSAYLSGKTTGMCFATQLGCQASCSRPQPMFYCNKSTNTCAQTTAQYNPNNHTHSQDGTLCEANLEQYIPGNTTQACYATQSACDSNCPLPTPSGGIHMYFCNTSNYTCQKTSGLYDAASQMQFDTFQILSCSDNLAIHLSGKTNGACYSTASACQNACVQPGSATNTPIPTATRTPTPTVHQSTVTPIKTPTPTLKQSTPTPTSIPSPTPTSGSLLSWLFPTNSPTPIPTLFVTHTPSPTSKPGTKYIPPTPTSTHTPTPTQASLLAWILPKKDPTPTPSPISRSGSQGETQQVDSQEPGEPVGFYEQELRFADTMTPPVTDVQEESGVCQFLGAIPIINFISDLFCK